MKSFNVPPRRSSQARGFAGLLDDFKLHGSFGFLLATTARSWTLLPVTISPMRTFTTS
jgi:hypothetical protein